MKLIGMTALALAASTALSGCAVLGVAQQASDFVDKQNEVDALSTTSTMPTGGSANYDGEAIVGADFGSDRNVALLGDASLTATFTSGGGTVVGELDNFSGLVLTDSQVTALNNGTADTGTLIRAAKAARGSFAINSGVIAGTAIAAGTSGTVRMDGKDYEVSGDVAGEFRGDNAAAIKLNEGAAFQMTEDGLVPTGGSTIEVNATQ
jgi:hypothetical protein